METTGALWGDSKIAGYLGWSRQMLLRAISDKQRYSWLRAAIRFCPDRKMRYAIPDELDAALRKNPTLADLER